MKLTNPSHSTFCRLLVDGKKRAAVIESLNGSYALLRLMNTQTKIIVSVEELMEF